MTQPFMVQPPIEGAPLKILCDIGGTHARFACVTSEAQGKPLQKIKKYRAEEFSTFGDALDHYCAESDIKGDFDVLMATAAYPDGSVWRFVNQNTWILNPYDFELIMNDFEATTWGLIKCPVESRNLLKLGTPRPKNLPQCIIGPGTGLGLGYLVPIEGQKPHVQRTHGGHMPAASLNAEQGAIIHYLRQRQDKVLVFENLISGSGLYNINKAWRALNNLPETTETLEKFFETLEHRDKKEPLRIFHEFFGIFAAHAVITGHAYGGLYLTGGVLDRLIAQGLFDFQSFEKTFLLNSVDSVQRDLAATKIVHITDPYLAMRGLLNAAQE